MFLALIRNVHNIRPGQVDLQFIVKAFSKMHVDRRSFFSIHCRNFSLFKTKLLTIIEKIVKVRKLVKIEV